MHASPEVLEAIGVAANIYNGWDNTITSNGGKLKVGQGYASNNFLSSQGEEGEYIY